MDPFNAALSGITVDVRDVPHLTVREDRVVERADLHVAGR
jgi:hypothetical protein